LTFAAKGVLCSLLLGPFLVIDCMVAMIRNLT